MFFCSKREKRNSYELTRLLKPYFHHIDAPDFQNAIIGHLRRLIPLEKNLADELAVVLSLNKNAVYKRLSGTTPLTFDDLIRLAQYYRLPWWNIFHPEEHTFEAAFSGFTAKTSPLEYLHLLEREMDALRTSSDPQVWYVTTGLPDFYYFYFEELTLFQAFMWERMVWNNPAWQERKFSLDMPEKTELLPLSKRLACHYSHIPTVEIWNEYVLDNLLHQVRYIVESQLYVKEQDILAVISALKMLIRHVDKMAAAGRRFPPDSSPTEISARFQLFYNEIMQNNIFLIVKSGNQETAYSVLDNPNFIKITDPQVVGYLQDIFEKLLHRAVSLNKKGERFRKSYFNKLESRVVFFEQKVMMLLKGEKVTQPEW